MIDCVNVLRFRFQFRGQLKITKILPVILMNALNENLVIVIPARKNSKRLKNKNFKNFMVGFIFVTNLFCYFSQCSQLEQNILMNIKEIISKNIIQSAHYKIFGETKLEVKQKHFESGKSFLFIEPLQFFVTQLKSKQKL